MARVATVGYRLGTTAAPLCTETSALPGLLVDHAAAYDAGDRAAVSALLGLTARPQVAAVVAEGAAARAGVLVGDDIVAIDGVDTATLIAQSADPGLIADEIEERLAKTAAGSTIRLNLMRGETPMTVSIVPARGCAARFVLKTGKGVVAFSDKHNVGLGTGLVDFTRTDDELALVAGHELSHLIYHDASVKSDIGQRSKEDRADVLGASLARCAGYDVGKALDFWTRYKKRDWLRFVRDPTHRSIGARMKLIQANSMNGPCPPTMATAAPQQ